MDHFHRDTLTMDVAEGYTECEAIYRISASWGARRRGGSRELLAAHDCTLDGWFFGGRPQSRATAVALLGEAEVDRQEEAACIRWMEDAEADDADEWADDKYEEERI